MEERKEYFWAAPLIAGILMFISIFTPAFSASQYPVQEYYWMWGLAYTSVYGYGSNTLFIPALDPPHLTMPIFLAGLIPFIMILTGSLALLAISYRVKTGRTTAKVSANSWIGIGIMMIVGTIIYIVGVDFTMRNYIEYQLLDMGYPPPIIVPSIWEIYSAGFAVIAPFIGAGICIIGAIASKVSKTREVIIPEKEVFMKPEKVAISPDVEKPFRFCPNCGHQIYKDEQRFCTNCGFELKGIPMTQFP